MSEEIEIGQDDYTLNDLYIRRDDLQKKIANDPDDWTSKHLLESVLDEIKRKRAANLQKEQQHNKIHEIANKDIATDIGNVIKNSQL